MRTTPSAPSPDAGTRDADTSSGRPFRGGRWAVPLTLALLTGCSSVSSATPAVPATAGPATEAAPSAEVSPTPGTVAAASPSSAAPTPSETPVQALNPPSAAFLALDDLSVAARGTMSDYDREALFGGWIDADGDCEDTRNEVLARDLTGVTSDNGCTVETGTLADPYTGTTIDFVRGVTTSGAVQVDHVVSVGNAWVTGARRLSQAERVAFYNDPLNLLAVDGPSNGAKSDEDASGWLPPDEAFACDMVAVQIAVKTKYALWVTAPEKNAMAEVLSTCPAQELPTGAAFVDIPGGSTAGPAPAEQSPAGGTTAPAQVHFANCTEARAAGAAPLHRGDPGFRDAMDGDKDGVACE